MGLVCSGAGPRGAEFDWVTIPLGESSCFLRDVPFAVFCLLLSHNANKVSVGPFA